MGQSMEDNKSVSTALIELIGRAFWPIIVVIAIIIFKPYLETFLEAASSQVKRATTVKIGSIDISISQSNLPKPTLSVSKKLPEIDSDLMNYILLQDPSASAVEECYSDQAPEELSAEGAVTRLSKLDLLEFKELKGKKTSQGEPTLEPLV